MSKPDHESYQSPFAWRYGSREMRALWSEAERRRQMRRVWLALAEAQFEAGLVSAEQLDDLRSSADDIDIERAEEIETRTRHDVMAEILAWAERAPVGGGAIHLGATSADITDNVDALRIRDALALIRTRLRDVIVALAGRVEETADVITLGWTHIQPAAPTTVGYRLASTLQDLVTDLEVLDGTSAAMVGKGFKGAVGTSASYKSLLAGSKSATTAEEMEGAAMRRLGLRPALVSTQVYPRKMDWVLLTGLAGLAATASRFALNVRVLQSPPFGELSEGFADGQVGSSAMPWKRNPIDAENICSLARYVASLPTIAWNNEASSILERTLDDSANRRIALPEAFLATDEILRRLARLTELMSVETGAVTATLARYGPFAAAERVLISAAGAGGDRQHLHARIRDHCLAAWARLEAGREGRLGETLAAEPDITAWLEPGEVLRLMSSTDEHVGDAPDRARRMAAVARSAAVESAKLASHAGRPSRDPGPGG